ncbi:hypothetical protein [Kordiimonas gwangyangensis]|uniref:hypothetical protein n=1 Tax=Kordiimonas gwangyangensis TaxID=288022 RepID=UPI000378ED02|nr:hypothetical protein [Kordiimonas gwangyangensis]
MQTHQQTESGRPGFIMTLVVMMLMAFVSLAKPYDTPALHYDAGLRAPTSPEQRAIDVLNATTKFLARQQQSAPSRDLSNLNGMEPEESTGEPGFDVATLPAAQDFDFAARLAAAVGNPSDSTAQSLALTSRHPRAPPITPV